MKRNAVMVVAALISAAAAGVSQAVVIGISPPQQTAGVGSPVQANLVVQDLGQGTAPSLGAFDIGVSFNPGVLGFRNFTFGDPGLGDQLDLSGQGSVTRLTPDASGNVSVVEVSLDPAELLNSAQAPSFVLGTFTFDPLAVGSSDLLIDINALADALGGRLLVDTTQDGLVQIQIGLPPGAVGAVAQAAGDPNGASVGNAIQAACDSGLDTGQFQADCTGILDATAAGDPGVAEALNQIAIKQVATYGRVAVDSALVTKGTIASRLAAIHSAGSRLASNASFGTFSRNLANLDSGEPSGGGASADALYGPIGVFINGRYISTDQSRNRFERGFDSGSGGVTFGADYRFSDHWLAGVAGGYINSDADVNDNGGKINTGGWDISIFGTYYATDSFYVDALASYGQRSYDMDRNIRYVLPTQSITVSQVATSSTDSNQYTLGLGTGYQMSQGAWTLTPSVRLDYLSASVDGFSERMVDPAANGGGLALQVQDQDINSLTTSLGGHASYAVSRSWGVLLPQAWVHWIHEFKDNSRVLPGSIVADVSGQGTFTVTTASPDRNFFDLGIGVSAQLAKGRAAFLSVETLVGREDIDTYTIQGGLRFEF